MSDPSISTDINARGIVTDDPNDVNSLSDTWHQNVKTHGINRNIQDGHIFSRPMNYLTKYNSMNKHEGLDIHTSQNGFMALTRPDCNMEQENISSDEQFSTLQYSDEGCMILNNLTSPIAQKKGTMLISNSIGPTPFVSMLSQQMINVSGIKDVIVEKYENDGDFAANRQSLFAGIQESNSIGEVTITYQDDINLNILMFHHMWIRYMHNIARGIMYPEDNNIKKKIIDYMSSIYIIILKQDGMSISAFYKLTGVFPINAPWSNIGLNPGTASDGKTTISYSYSHIERMNPSILFDFNTVVMTAYNKNRREFSTWYSNRTPDYKSLDAYEDDTDHPTYNLNDMYGGEGKLAGSELYYTMTGDNKYLGHPFIDRTGKFGYRKF